MLAGGLIAGAIVLVRTPVASRSTAEPLRTPTVSPSTVSVTVRPVDVARDHIRGKVDAPVTLVEYSDTECPFCKRFHVTMRQALKDYDGKIRWVYRHFPLDGLHAKARGEAVATECAAAQGKFWEYLDRIFELTPSNDGLDPARLSDVATELGLDLPAFDACRKDPVMARRVQDDVEDAAKANGQGTPYTVILGPRGQVVPFSGAQPYENLRSVIDALIGTP